VFQDDTHNSSTSLDPLQLARAKRRNVAPGFRRQAEAGQALRPSDNKQTLHLLRPELIFASKNQWISNLFALFIKSGFDERNFVLIFISII
jgi:hypothetical protein